MRVFFFHPTLVFKKHQTDTKHAALLLFVTNTARVGSRDPPF